MSLHQLIRNDDYKGFKAFMDDYITSNQNIHDLLDSRDTQPDKPKFTPLQVACEIGNLKIIKTLCRLGANVNTDLLDIEFREEAEVPYVTPAALACWYGYFDVVVYLVEKRKAVFEVGEVVKCLGGDVASEDTASDDGEGGDGKNCGVIGVDGRSGVETVDGSGCFSLLYPSVFKGHLEIVNYLIRIGANVNIVDEFQRTPAMSAIVGDQLEVLKLLIANKATFGVDRNGLPIQELNLAVVHGRTEIVLYFLENRIVYGNNVSEARSNSITVSLEEVITTSIVEKRMEILRLFVSEFPYIAIQPKLILSAAINGTPEILKLLLSHKLAESFRETTLAELFRSIPLKFTPTENFVDNVEVLIQFGANVNYESDLIGPAAFIASTISLPLLKLLENHGANLTSTFEARRFYIKRLHLKDTFGMTPLMLATKAGNLDIVNLLIKHGADVNDTNDKSMSVIQTALEFAHVDISILVALLQAGAVPNQYDIITVLKRHDFEILRLMLPSNSMRRYPASFFDGLLHVAWKGAEKNLNRPCINSIKYIIENGNINLNFQISNGDTLSHYVVQNNNFEMLDYLIGRGANVMLKNNSGKNVMAAAVYADALGCISVLLDHNKYLANERITEKFPIEIIKGIEFINTPDNNEQDDVRNRNVEGFVKLASLTNNNRLVWLNINRLHAGLISPKKLAWFGRSRSNDIDPRAVAAFEQVTRDLMYFRVRGIGNMGDVDHVSKWTRSVVRKYHGILIVFVARNWSRDGSTLPLELHPLILRYRDVLWKPNQYLGFGKKSSAWFH